MSTPNSQNLYLGAGEVWFNRFDAAGNPTQWRHLGNVSKLDLNPNVQTVEKYGSMQGSRALLARAVSQTGGEVDLTLDEFDNENLAIALLGSTAAFSQTAGSATTQAITGTSKKGTALSTGKLKITVTAVQVGVTTYALGTDYTVDSDSGLITITPNSTIPDASAITWSGSYPAIASTQVNALSNAIINGMLRFRSASDATGPRYILDIWKLNIAPSAALALIGNQFGDIGLKGNLLQDTTKPAGNQFFQLVQL